jgi:hypothetical protein
MIATPTVGAAAATTTTRGARTRRCEKNDDRERFADAAERAEQRKQGK